MACCGELTMTIYFTPSSLGFVPAKWRDDGTYNADTWPSDAVLLTQDEADEYWKTVAPDGKQLGATVVGRPCWVDVPPPSHDVLVAQAESHRAQLAAAAEQSIRPLERAKQLGIATSEELAALTEWERYSVFLMRVDIGKAPDIDWPTVPIV